MIDGKGNYFCYVQTADTFTDEHWLSFIDWASWTVSVLSSRCQSFVNECECTRSNFELQAKEVKHFEVFTKMSSLSPLLEIPMLQILIKHLKWSLFVFSEMSISFSAAAAAASQAVLLQHSSFMNINIEFSMTWVQTSEIWFLNPCWWKHNDHADWHLQSVCISHAISL